LRLSATESTPERTLAYVTCQSHGSFNNKPMRYIDDCDLIDHHWNCSAPQLEVLVSVKDRDIKLRPWHLTPETASQLLLSIRQKGYFQGLSLDEAIGSSCDVSKTKDPDIIELKCQSVIGISYWCPQTQLTGCPRILFVGPESPDSY
jgi:hypothetical protein